MALTDESMGTTMLVQPSGGYPYPMYNGFGGNNGFGGDWAWIILLLLLGWGNNGFGGYGGGGSDLYPWMNQAELTSGGFRDQMINGNITSIRDDLGNISTQLCNGFSNQQMTTMQQGFNLQSQLADCCCENRLGTADLKYTIATEECATRTADATNTRDIIDSQTRGTQAILDKLCQLELDGVRNQLAQAERENVGLQNQLNMANIRESQTAQNAFISQGFANEVDALYNRLNTCPVPTTPVYGRTPIFTCNQNVGCGCGM